MRDDRRRVQDVKEAIEHIERYTAGGEKAFYQNELVQVWVIHHLTIIGEAVRGLSQEFREKHRQVPWSKIIGLRNILVHNYFNIDTERVWLIISKDIPELKTNIERIDPEQVNTREHDND